MLGHLIRKENLDQILSLRFLVLSIVGTLTIWLSLYDGYAYYRARVTDYRVAQKATGERVQKLLAVEDEGMDEIGRVGYHIHKPPTPLCIFVRGLEPTLGRSGTTGWGEQIPRLKWSPAETEPVLGLFFPLDLGMVVQVVLSLFVVLFTYDAVCGEKEGGTLSLTASFPVPRHHLLLGKAFGALIPTLSAFGLPLLLGIAAVFLMPEVQFTASELGRLGLILVAFGFYLTAYICVGLLASSLTHRAATSFVLLLAFWVVTVGVLPRLSLIAAEGIRPAPSAHELNAEKEAVYKGAVKKRRELRDQWRRERTESGRERGRTPEDREAYSLYDREIGREANQTINSQWDRLDEAFRNRYNARLDLAVALARLSPAFALKNATVLLAGTGVDRHRRFFTAYDLYRKRYLEEFYLGVFYRDWLRRVRPEKYGEYQWDVSDMPRFAYQEVWSGGDVQRALIGVGVIAVWGLVFFAGAYVAMVRYDLR